MVNDSCRVDHKIIVSLSSFQSRFSGALTVNFYGGKAPSIRCILIETNVFITHFRSFQTEALFLSPMQNFRNLVLMIYFHENHIFSKTNC